MKDHRWEDAYHQLRGLLRCDDIVLLPRGDWPDLPCRSRFYDDLIDIGEATVFVLHKARFGSIDKAMLKSICEAWQCIFGNDVFLCFSRETRAAADLRHGRNRLHYGVLHRFLQSRQLRRRAGHLWFVHLPKAAGTSMWQALSRIYSSRIYYPSVAAFHAHPPDIAEYDLIGGHLPLCTIAPFVERSDRVIGLIREPEQRLLSAFLHSRRPGEDPATFTATMRAMRNLPFREFIQSDDGKLEAQQQLIMLGRDGAPHREPPDYRACLERACAFLSSEQFVFAPCQRSGELLATISRRFRFFRRRPDLANHTDYRSQFCDVAEFNAALDLLRPITATERELYEFVANRFNNMG